MRTFWSGYWFVAAIFLVFISCGSGGQERKQDNGNVVARPVFSSDSAYNYIAAQLAIGTRVPGSETHARCRDFLAEFFRAHGAKVTVQEGTGRLYDGTEMPLYNIIAAYNPDAIRRVMLCAHWDTRAFADRDPDEANHRKPIMGANDGASGVGVLMEIARQLNIRKPGIGVDIILFDLEDWGIPSFHEDKYSDDSWCLGSQYWAKNLHQDGYSPMYGILLDMVGAPGAQFFKEGVSMHFAPDVVNKVWNCAANMGFGSYFIDRQGGMITDDHLYVNTLSGIKCINIVQYNPFSANGFGNYWHTMEDDMRNVDKTTLHVVGETVMEVIYNQ